MSCSTPEPEVPHGDVSGEETSAEAQHLSVVDEHTNDGGSVEILFPAIESSEGVSDVEIRWLYFCVILWLNLQWR